VLADDTRFVWFKANFDLIDSYLSSIDWQLVLQNNPEALQFWSAVESTIYDAVEIAVPKQTTPAYHSSMRCIPKKYPRIIRKLRVKKRYLWRQLRTDKNNSALRTEYKNCVNEWREQLRNYNIQSEVKVIEADSIGVFYNYVSKRTTYRSGIGALQDNDGNIVTDDKAKAELFNEYFASVGTVDNGVRPVVPTSLIAQSR